MELERGRQLEIVVSIAVVGIFVGVLVAIGLRYNRGDLGPQGGLVMIGAITVFVLAMGGVGLGLAHYLNQE